MWLGWFLACVRTSSCGGAEADPTADSISDLVVIADRIVEVRDGRIVAVHAPDSDAPVALGPHTLVRRADRVTAGFVDAHGHPDGLGQKLAELDLGGADSYADALEQIRSAHPMDGWLLGGGWDQERWSDVPEGGWPLAADLERLHPGVNVVLRRVDGHAAWVSQTTLGEADLHAATPDPPGGRIVRDRAGNPSGVLLDAAIDRVAIPAPSREVDTRRVQAALVLIAAKGLSGVHMMGATDRWVSILEALARADQLPVRLWVYVDPGTEAAARLLESGPWREGRLAVIGIKAYADGALGSRGALLSAPYTDAPELVGIERTPAAEIERLAIAARGAKIGFAVHAIGDRAVTNVLDAFEAARAAHPEAIGLPMRVEHAQVVRPDDRARFAALGAIASMQPTHATSDAPWAPARLGPERIGHAYAWRSLLDAGAVLAFGSDFPVEPTDPALGLAAAATRGGWTVEQAVSLDEAIAAFTSGPARAVGEADLGAIEVGKLADLTLWAVADDRWRAVATVVGGEVVAEAPITRQ